MKKFYFLLLLFFSFDSFAVYTLTQGTKQCTPSPDNYTKALGTEHLSTSDALTYIQSLWSSTDRCGGQYFSGVSRSYQYSSITARFKGNQLSYNFSGETGCDFDSCKRLAAQECQSNGTTLDQSSYFYNGPSDYEHSCNEPPPEQPIKSNEECENLSNNQCNSRGSVSTRDFTDNGDFTYQCDYTCGDGTSGDQNGIKSNNNDGICDPNDPNDLADCDTADQEDPNSVDGSYTPDESNEIEYSADGTNQSDGTGTDNLTNVQGDVLINEIVKLKNENANQIIKSKDAVVSAVEGIDSNNKLDDVITAINNSGGGSQSTDLSPVVSKLDDIKNSITGTTVIKIKKPTDGVISLWESDYPQGAVSVWDDTKHAFNNTEYVQFLSTFNPNLSAGTALDMQLCFDLGAMGNYGCHALPVDSSIWSAIRIFILVTAGFLCRRIIFGG
jgi:hypothetical protein